MPASTGENDGLRMTSLEALAMAMDLLAENANPRIPLFPSCSQSPLIAYQFLPKLDRSTLRHPQVKAAPNHQQCAWTLYISVCSIMAKIKASCILRFTLLTTESLRNLIYWNNRAASSICLIENSAAQSRNNRDRRCNFGRLLTFRSNLVSTSQTCRERRFVRNSKDEAFLEITITSLSLRNNTRLRVIFQQLLH